MQLSYSFVFVMFVVPNGNLLVTLVHLLVLLFRRRLTMLMQYLSRIDLISKDNRHIFQGLACNGAS